MDGYVFKNMNNSEYRALVPNIWQQRFTNMFELEQIMRQSESKEFAGILNRLREGLCYNFPMSHIKSRFFILIVVISNPLSLHRC